jgi:hypothetical protein
MTNTVPDILRLAIAATKLEVFINPSDKRLWYRYAAADRAQLRCLVEHVLAAGTYVDAVGSEDVILVLRNGSRRNRV